MVQGDSRAFGLAVLRGLPFSYRVELPTDKLFGLVWLQDCTTHEQWECVVKDYTRFTRYGFALPVETVLRILASWLGASSRFSSRCRGGEQKLALRNVFGDKYLIAPVQVVVQGVRWSATYTFPLRRIRLRATPPTASMRSVFRDLDNDSESEDYDECDDE